MVTGALSFILVLVDSAVAHGIVRGGIAEPGHDGVGLLGAAGERREAE